MARRKVNKSAAIRDYLSQNPTATPKIIKEELARRGIIVTDSLVSLVKYKSASRRGVGRPRRRGRRPGRMARAAAGNSISINDLISAKALAERMGGVERAKEAIGMLERLL